MSALVNSFTALPRSARWLIAAGAVFALYFLALEPVLDRTNRYADRADRLETDLRRVAELESGESDDGKFLAASIRSYGKPYLPTDPAARPEAIHRIIDDILEDHGVTDRVKTEKSASLSGELADRLSAGRIERHILEISFEAEQEEVAAIIAELEQAPGVSTISRVKIDRTGVYGLSTVPPARKDADTAADPPRLVRVAISAESWNRAASSDSSFTGEGD